MIHMKSHIKRAQCEKKSSVIPILKRKRNNLEILLQVNSCNCRSSTVILWISFGDHCGWIYWIQIRSPEIYKGHELPSTFFEQKDIFFKKKQVFSWSYLPPSLPTFVIPLTKVSDIFSSLYHCGNHFLMINYAQVRNVDCSNESSSRGTFFSYYLNIFVKRQLCQVYHNSIKRDSYTFSICSSQNCKNMLLKHFKNKFHIRN